MENLYSVIDKTKARGSNGSPHVQHICVYHNATQWTIGQL